jgi:flagellar protein FliO/FliZ
MSMFLAVIQAVFALAVSLGLFGVGVYAFRRWGPQGLLKLTAKADRRMHLVESLTLDAQRRLVLVRLDAKEHLILLGEGRVVQASELEAPRG